MNLAALATLTTQLGLVATVIFVAWMCVAETNSNKARANGPQSKSGDES